MTSFNPYHPYPVQSAQLQSARLQSAQLQSAQLQSAQLQSAQLQSAQLQSAQLQAAQLQSAQLDFSKDLYSMYSNMRPLSPYQHYMTPSPSPPSSSPEPFSSPQENIKPVISPTIKLEHPSPQYSTKLEPQHPSPQYSAPKLEPHHLSPQGSDTSMEYPDKAPSVTSLDSSPSSGPSSPPALQSLPYPDIFNTPLPFDIRSLVSNPSLYSLTDLRFFKSFLTISNSHNQILTPTSPAQQPLLTAHCT